MSIVNLKKFSNLKEIEGKFTCLEESFMANRPMGEPALITRVSGKRVYYRVLPILKGGWNPETKRHMRSLIPEEHEQYCSVNKLEYICSTAEEAIALYNASLDLEEEIRRHTKEMAERFHAEIESGKFDGNYFEKATKIVIKVIAATLGIKTSKIKTDQTLVDLGVDELDHVEIIMAIEDEVGAEFGDVESEAANTVEKLINLARKYIK